MNVGKGGQQATHISDSTSKPTFPCIDVQQCCWPSTMLEISNLTRSYHPQLLESIRPPIHKLILFCTNIVFLPALRCCLQWFACGKGHNAKPPTASADLSSFGFWASSSWCCLQIATCARFRVSRHRQELEANWLTMYDHALHLRSCSNSSGRSWPRNAWTTSTKPSSRCPTPSWMAIPDTPTSPHSCDSNLRATTDSQSSIQSCVCRPCLTHTLRSPLYFFAAELWMIILELYVSSIASATSNSSEVRCLWWTLWFLCRHEACWGLLKFRLMLVTHRALLFGGGHCDVREVWPAISTTKRIAMWFILIILILSKLQQAQCWNLMCKLLFEIGCVDFLPWVCYA